MVIDPAAAHRRAGRWSVSLRQACSSALAVVAAALAVVDAHHGQRASGRSAASRSCATAHVARPLIVALLLATLAGRGVMAARVVFPAAVLLLVLPINAYEDVLRRAASSTCIRSARRATVWSRARTSERQAGRPRARHLRDRRAAAGSCTRTSTISVTSAVGAGRTLDAAALQAALFDTRTAAAGADRRRRLPRVQGGRTPTRSRACRPCRLRECCCCCRARTRVCGPSAHDPRAAAQLIPIDDAGAMTLSIVVPAFNEEARLGATLDELCDYLPRQPWDWEIRVVDDGSTDRTARIAERVGGARSRASSCSASRTAARAAP